MKIPACIAAALLMLSGLHTARAACLTNIFDDVPPQVQCGQKWTNQNITLYFTPTIASEDNGQGGCSNFGAFYHTVELWPCRLALEFKELGRQVVRIETDIYDKVGPDSTKLFAYSGGATFAQAGNTTSGTQTLALDFKTIHPDVCVIRSFQAYVNEIRIFTEDTLPPRLSIVAAGSMITVSWPTNSGPFTLERADALVSPLAWTPHTNSIQCQGTDFTSSHAAQNGSQFFRLRRN